MATYLQGAAQLAQSTYQQLPNITDVAPKAAIPLATTLTLSGPQALPMACVYLVSSSVTECLGEHLCSNSKLGNFMKHTLNIAGSSVTGNLYNGGGLVYQVVTHGSSYFTTQLTQKAADFVIHKYGVANKWAKASIKTATSMITAYGTTKAIELAKDVINPDVNTYDEQSNVETKADTLAPAQEQEATATETLSCEEKNYDNYNLIPNCECVSTDRQAMICSMEAPECASKQEQSYVDCLNRNSGQGVIVEIPEGATARDKWHKIYKSFDDNTPECHDLQPQYFRLQGYKGLTTYHGTGTLKIRNPCTPDEVEPVKVCYLGAQPSVTLTADDRKLLECVESTSTNPNIMTAPLDYSSKVLRDDFLEKHKECFDFVENTNRPDTDRKSFAEPKKGFNKQQKTDDEIVNLTIMPNQRFALS